MESITAKTSEAPDPSHVQALLEGLKSWRTWLFTLGYMVSQFVSIPNVRLRSIERRLWDPRPSLTFFLPWSKDWAILPTRRNTWWVKFKVNTATIAHTYHDPPRPCRSMPLLLCARYLRAILEIEFIDIGVWQFRVSPVLSSRQGAMSLTCGSVVDIVNDVCDCGLLCLR